MHKQSLIMILLLMAACTVVHGQSKKTIFRAYTIKGIPENRFGEILVSKGGQKFISASEFTIAKISFGSFATFTTGLSEEYSGIKNFKEIFTGDPLKAFAESWDGAIFCSSAQNQILYLKKHGGYMEFDIPPFYFPIKANPSTEIKELWFDSEDNLYLGVAEAAFYIVPKAGRKASLDSGIYKIGKTNEGTMLILKGELPVIKIILGRGIAVYSFAESKTEKDIIWLGTNNGLYYYNKITGSINKCLAIGEKITITHIEIPGNSDIWFSTLEKGMGVYHRFTNSVEFFSYPKKMAGSGTLYSIQNFCIKSTDDFF